MRKTLVATLGSILLSLAALAQDGLVINVDPVNRIYFLSGSATGNPRLLREDNWVVYWSNGQDHSDDFTHFLSIDAFIVSGNGITTHDNFWGGIDAAGSAGGGIDFASGELTTLTGIPDVRFDYSGWSDALKAELERKATVGESLPATTAGSSAFTMTFRLMTLDTEPPTITDCPGSLVFNATRLAGAVADFTLPAASDNVELASFGCDWLPGDTFPIGETTVTCLATDTAGLTAECIYTVRVKGALEQTQDLIQAVAYLPIHHGIKTSLVAELTAVKVALAKDCPVIASHGLRAFLQHVKAQSGKKLAKAQADSLITEAERIRSVIGQ